MNLIKLDKDYNIKLESQITNFLAPDFIYIPIKNEKISFQKDDLVKKGDSLFLNIYSPVSGRIIGVKDCTLYDGTTTKCLVVTNDFKENYASRIATRKKLNNITLSEIEKDIKDIELKRVLNNKNIKYIIISGIDDEPYIANEIFVQKENTKIILETIDALLNVFQDSKAYVVIKNTDRENIESYTNFIGTYKKIELRMVDDLYMIGEEENLIEKLNIKEDYLYLKATELFMLYSNIKKRKSMFEKYITVTGNGIVIPRVFNVKIGTKIMDIISYYYNINIDDYDIYINGLMRGKKSDISNLIVTKELDGIIITKKELNVEKSCINCGKCNEVCPINSEPLKAYKEKCAIECIGCGLCTYICPVYINLRKYVEGESNE